MASPRPRPGGEDDERLGGGDDRAREQSGGLAKLEGNDVLELTRFAEKKEWIDDKIQFLSSLSPVDAIAPHPPERSPTTKEELKAWWLEHDRIESEVDHYDMGDLAKLKSVAKSVTQHDLSPADTDLIEITLTTLFAVDKLLGLLRNRRKALTLLNYRLLWEVTVATAAAEHQQILANLPRFLEKSRWTIPPSVDPTRLRHPPRELSSASASRTSSSSLPQSTSSSSISSNHSNHSTSAMSRTMRSEVLSLELAGQKSKIHSLVASSIPATAHRLDKLIDASPSPLPEAFLDAQDKVEEESKAFTEGLGSFLADMVKQWRNADEVFWIASGVESKAEALDREVDEAQLKLPKREMAEEFEKRVADARADLKEAERSLGERRRAEGFLPTPTHSAIPDQAEENRQLLSTLEHAVEAATAALEGADAKVKGYRFATEAFERSVLLRSEMDAALRALRTFVDDAARLTGSPDLNDVRCLAPSPEEAAFDESFRRLASDVAPTLAAATLLLQRGASVVVDLNRAGIDPNVRQAVKETTAGLSRLKSTTEQVLADDEAGRQRLAAARAWRTSIQLCEREIESARDQVVGELGESRWRAAQAERRTPVDVEALLADLRQRVDAALERPIANGDSLLSERHPTVHAHLRSRTAALRGAYDEILRLRALLANVRAQRDAATSLLSDVTSIDSDVTLVLSEADIALAKPSEQWDADGMAPAHAELTARLDAAAARHSDTTSATHFRIPFIASPSPTPLANGSPASHLPSTLAGVLARPASPAPPPLPFDLDVQDELVRTTVNEALAFSSSKIDEARQRLASLEHQGQAFVWDRSHATAHTELEELEEKVRTVESSFSGRSGNDEQELATLQATALALAAALTTSSSTLSNVSSSLSNLLSSPTSSSPPFNSHPERHSRLASTTERHSAVSTANEAVLASIALAEEERKRKSAVDAALRARAAEIEDDVAGATGKLDAFVTAERSLEGRPDLSTERCLDPTLAEDEFLRQSSVLAEEASIVLAETPEIFERASAVVADLQREALDSETTKEIVRSSEALRASRSAVEGIQAAASTARGQLVVARSLDAALKEAEQAIEAMRVTITHAADQERWTEGQPATPALDIDAYITDLRQRLDASLAGPLANAGSLKDDHPALCAHLQSRTNSLASSFASLIVLRAHLDDVRAQTDATQSSFAAVSVLAKELAEATSEVALADSKSRFDWPEGALDAKVSELAARHLALAQRQRDLASSTLASVPNLTFPPNLPESPLCLPSSLSDVSYPPPSSHQPPFEVAAQNACVRDALDRALGAVESANNLLSHKIDSLRHSGAAFQWDHSHDAVHVELSALEERARSDQAALETAPSGSDAFYASALAASSATAAALAHHHESINALSAKLDTLRNEEPLPSSSSDLHAARITQAQDLAKRHAAALATSAATSAAITLAREKLAERLASEALRKERRAAWVVRREELASRLRDAHHKTAELVEGAAAETQRLEAWTLAAQQERLTLLTYEHLNPESTSTEAPLDHARTVAPTLAEQLRVLDAISGELAASEATLSHDLSTIESDDTLEFATQAAAALQAELPSAREQVERFGSTLSQAESEASAWPAARSEELEARRNKVEAEWRRRGAELDSRLLRVQENLDSFETSLSASEGLVASTSHSNGFTLPDVPPTPRPNERKPAGTPYASLERAISRVNSDLSLSHASAELEAVRSLDAELQREADNIAEPSHFHHELSPPLGTLDERLLRLRQRTSAFQSAAEQVEANDEEDAFPQGVRRSPARTRVGITSTSDVEDVFGPTLHSMPFGDDEEHDDFDGGELSELQQQLDSVHTGLWLDEHVSLQLPTVDEYEAIQRQLSLVSAQLDDLAADANGAEPALDLTPLRRDLDRKLLDSQHILALSSFRSKVADADSALSDLLTSIDAATPGLDLPPSSRPSTPGGSPSVSMPLSEALLDATRAVTTARKDAVPLCHDVRVNDHISRIEQTFGEMSAMIDDLGSSVSRPSSATSSVQSSKSSLSHQLSRPQSRSTPSREGSRAGSSRFSSATRPPSSRATSSRGPLDTELFTPRKPSSSLIPTPTPRSRVTSSIAATIPRAFSFGSAARTASLSKSTSGADRDSSAASLRKDASYRDSTYSSRRESSTSSRRDSLASSTSSLSRSTRMTSPSLTRARGLSASENRRRSGFPLCSSPPRVKTPYKPNPKRKVDVEVGKIVNRLPVNIPIRSAENETKIDSGMYWIGERLYFCRILRSKTAMLRVGGGWQELSAFLLSHYSDTAEIVTLQISPSSSKTGESSWSLTKSTSSMSLAAPSTPASTLSLSVRSTSGSHRSPLRKGSSQHMVHATDSPDTSTPKAKIWHI